MEKWNFWLSGKPNPSTSSMDDPLSNNMYVWNRSSPTKTIFFYLRFSFKKWMVFMLWRLVIHVLSNITVNLLLPLVRVQGVNVHHNWKPCYFHLLRKRCRSVWEFDNKFLNNGYTVVLQTFRGIWCTITFNVILTITNVISKNLPSSGTKWLPIMTYIHHREYVTSQHWREIWKMSMLYLQMTCCDLLWCD